METWPPSPLHVIMNLTMLQSFLMFPIVDNSYWTLAVELEFYCVIGLIFVAGLIERIEILCLGFTALAMCLRIALVGANIEPSTIETFGVPKYGLLQYGHFFVIGICLFQFHAQRVSKLTTPVLLAALAYSCWGGSPASLSPDGLRYFGITCALTLLTWIAVSGRLGLSRCSPLIMLGGISYPLYLVHQRIGSGLMEALHRLGLPDPAAFFTAVATVAALAVAIHVFIEFPGRRCLRRVLAIPPGLPAGLAIGPSAVARLSD